MANYRKVELALWTDERVARLSRPQPNGQSLLVYLLTGPRTIAIPGVVVAREAVMADDLRWPVEGFRKAFGEASREGLVKVDWEAGLIILPKALITSSGGVRDTNKPESPNVVIGWGKAWQSVPECALKRELYCCLRAFCEAFGASFLEAFLKAFGQPSPNQEQEQEQEQEERECGAFAPSVSVPVLPAIRAPLALPGFVESTGKRRSAKGKKAKASNPLVSRFRPQALRVLAWLTRQNGIAYEGCDEHVLLIAKLLELGYSVVDMRKVIAYCAMDASTGAMGWSGNEEMERYLRPATLFGPKKFQSYIDPARAWFARNFPKLVLREEDSPPVDAAPSSASVPSQGEEASP